MKKFSKEDFEIGLDYYDPSGRVFRKIEATVKAKKDVSKTDILHILKWKLGRSKAAFKNTVTPEHLFAINDAIRNAGTANTKNVIDALEALDLVPEIGLAVATTILTVCYPDKFTIIDVRVLESLKLKPDTTSNWTARKYVEEFLPAVVKQSKNWGCSLRDADKALWGLSVKKSHDEILK